MNQIQKISLELQARRRREDLGLAADSDHSDEEVRELWHASRLEQLKNRLRRQFASPERETDATGLGALGSR